MGAREELSALLRPLIERMHTGYCWKKTQDGPRRIDVAWSEILLSEHTANQVAYGLCPISPGTSTTRVACLDLDSHKGEVPWAGMVAASEMLATVLECDGYTPHRFRSSGGSGIHMYLTWAEPQDAYSVREMLKAALTVCNLKPGTKGVAHREVEIFPKQNEVKADGYGSMFILPFSGKSEPLGGFHAWVDSPPVPVRTREERSAASAATRLLPGVARLKSALDAIPNSGTEELDYDAWRNLVFALHAATDGSDVGLDLAHEFSARSSKYDSDFLNNRVWPYIRTERDGGTITEGTLFNAAASYGWEDPTTADDFDVVEGNGDGDLPRDGVNPALAPRFTFIAAAAFAEAAPQEMIVADVLPDADLAMVYGESGSGKSFWTLDLVQCIARNTPWRGHRVKGGRVAYIAAEGAGGFRKRIKAYNREHTLDTTDLFVLPDAPSFLEAAHVKDVIKRLRDIGPVKVVVVDTLAQVAPGGAENSSEDMGKIIMHCRMIRKHTGAMVILIHHSGKDAAKGARGWSGMKGAVDTEIEIVRVEHDRVATVSKQKDGEDGMEFGFKLRQIQIGVNAEGEAITSCVVDHGAAISKTTRKAAKKTGDFGDALREEIGGLNALTGEWPTLPELQEVMRTKMVQEEGKKDQRANRVTKAVDRLVLAGHVELLGGRIVLVGVDANL